MRYNLYIPTYAAAMAAVSEGATVVVDAEPKMDTAQATALANTLDALAEQLGGKLGDKFGDDLEALTKAKELTIRGPIMCMVDLQQALGDETLFSLPYPGTEYKDTANTNARPDRYKRPVHTSDGIKWKATSFTNELTRRSTRGKVYVAELESISKAGNKETRSLAMPKHQTMANNPVQLRSEKTRIENLLSDWRKVTATAIKVHRKLGELTDMQHVEFKLITRTVTNADGSPVMVEIDGQQVPKQEVYPTTEPIRIQNKHNPDEYDVFSVGSLLRLNIPEAVKKGGMLSHLVDTLARAPQIPEGDTAKVIPTITNIGHAIQMIDELAGWAGDGEGDADPVHVAALAKLCAANVKGSDDLIESIGDMLSAFDGMWKDLEPRWKAIKRKRQQAAQAEINAKTNAA